MPSSPNDIQRPPARDSTLLEALYWSAPIGCALVDPDYRFVRVNRALAELNGVRVEDHLGRRVSDVLPELWPRVEPCFRAVLERGETRSNTEIVGATPASGGAERAYLANYYPVRVGGILVGAGVIVTDITERKDLEERLLATEQQAAQTLTLLETLQATAPIGFAYVDRDLRLVRANAELARLLELPATELQGGRLLELFPRHWPEAEGMYLEVLRTGEPQLNVVIRDLPTGRPGTWRLSHYPVRLHGEITGVGVIVEDVTERGQLEERVRHMQKIEAIGSLAGGVAHDFNNLIGAISGYAELIAQNPGVDEQARGDAEEIVKATKRAAALTTQLLDFSRKERPRAAPVSLNEAVGALDNLLRRLVGPRVALHVRLGGGAGNTRIDRGQLEQVIVNLAVNARDALGEGGDLTIETDEVDLAEPSPDGVLGAPPGRYVRVAVEDTGRGMDEETRARVFEPFFTTKPVGAGSGLGLATVYGIVAEAGGELRVLSAPGQGARFEVLLPATQELWRGAEPLERRSWGERDDPAGRGRGRPARRDRAGARVARLPRRRGRVG